MREQRLTEMRTRTIRETEEFLTRHLAANGPAVRMAIAEVLAEIARRAAEGHAAEPETATRGVPGDLLPSRIGRWIRSPTSLSQQ